MKQKVSLVLSGGSARGIAHIGVIEEIERQGYEIVSVSGTSMGSMVGGIYALGKLEEFKNWLYTLDKMRVFNLVDFTFSSQGLVKGDKVFNTMKEFIHDDNIENLKIHFVATATDIINGKEVVFTQGSVFEAIRASIAIPTVFTPVKTEKGLLVDGGVLNNIPINHVKRTSKDLLIVVNVNADVPILKSVIYKKEVEKKQSIYLNKIKEFRDHLYKTSPSNHKEKLSYFNLIDKTISLMINQMAQMSLSTFYPDILINISRETCGNFDFYKAEELVEIGRIEAINCFKRINK
ncbi:MAG: patatin-like phospholipase family protein [Bacteroidales bacterium]|jgi:NTE family protein|nr:patatin-like phospholipase family protein [Bacteroidales bacterium]